MKTLWYFIRVVCSEWIGLGSMPSNIESWSCSQLCRIDESLALLNILCAHIGVCAVRLLPCAWCAVCRLVPAQRDCVQTFRKIPSYGAWSFNPQFEIFSTFVTSKDYEKKRQRVSRCTLMIHHVSCVCYLLVDVTMIAARHHCPCDSVPTSTMSTTQTWSRLCDQCVAALHCVVSGWHLHFVTCRRPLCPSSMRGPVTSCLKQCYLSLMIYPVSVFWAGCCRSCMIPHYHTLTVTISQPTSTEFGLISVSHVFICCLSIPRLIFMSPTQLILICRLKYFPAAACL